MKSVCQPFLLWMAFVASTPLAVAADPLVAIPEGWRGIPDQVLGPGKGYAWFRCWIEFPKDWQVDGTELFLEGVDDAREAYLDGARVAAVGAFPPNYRSGLGDMDRNKIPADIIRLGSRQLLAIRIFYENENRTGFNVAAPAFFSGEKAIRLVGQWQFHVGDDTSWGNGNGAEPVSAATYSKVEPSTDVERTLRKLAGEEGPLVPKEALARMKAPDDLEIRMVLSEPEISQPLFMTFDERCRLWVVEFRQYPNPAGLKMVSRDKFLRTVFDKVPPAPPNHFKGLDRVSIHEDTDGDGHYDHHKTFVEGLSLVSSVAVGHGGVWVLNPPYLLFYPDRNQDDVPDADPEVRLEGFGIEDSHSIANSLRWGPDGWLYGAQGSTVSADIKRPGIDKQGIRSLGQLIWRYHPDQRIYEIFAEGGGNTFGVEIDDKGRIFSGHNGGDTRGFHYVQGGYSQKGFGKHGPLSNPYAFGYFPQMPHHQVQRFTHNFVIYHGSALPSNYDGKLFGVAPLQSHVVLSDFLPDRSSFKTKDIGLALSTSDTWFRPVDIKVGPDGGVYVADLYEQRIDHASHYQGRVDKSTGRIYRLQAKGSSPSKPVHYDKLSNAALVDALANGNQWHRSMAVRVLSERPSADVTPLLQSRIAGGSNPSALEALWALHSLRPLTDDDVVYGIQHENPYVRAWSVRLACDDGQISDVLLSRFVELAYREPHVEVRSQLASSSKRLAAVQGLPIAKSLLARSEDVEDVHIPLLLWWSLESKADSDRAQLLNLFRDLQVWKMPLVQRQILSRLMKRFAMAGSRKDLLTCAELLELSPDSGSSKILMAGFEEAFQGRSLRDIPNELTAAIAKAGGASLPLRLRQREPEAIRETMGQLQDEQVNATVKLQLVEVLGQIQLLESIPVLIRIATSNSGDSLRGAALTALQGYDDPSISQAIIQAHAGMSPDVRLVAQSVMASRRSWTLDFVKAIAIGTIAKPTVSTPVLKRFLLHSDPEIDNAVRESYGEIQGTTTAEMRKLVDKYAAIIGQGSGNPYGGRQVYRASCGKCHTLFDEGGRIGPDLTAFKRDDLNRMLLNVVNPSAEVREGFENYLIQTADGRTLNGFVTDQDKQVVLLKGIDGQTVTVPRDEIDEMRLMNTSLMPEELLKDFTDQQVRDLFAYLRSAQPLP